MSRALYNGLSAGLQRQMCFASVRLGFYEPTKKFYQDLFDNGKDYLAVISLLIWIPVPCTGTR